METLYYNHLKKLSFLVCCIFRFSNINIFYQIFKSMFYCFSLHVTATNEYNVHVCIYTVMYFTYGYNNDVNNYFFLLGLLYSEASAKT